MYDVPPCIQLHEPWFALPRLCGIFILKEEPGTGVCLSQGVVPQSNTTCPVQDVLSND